MEDWLWPLPKFHTKVSPNAPEDCNVLGSVRNSMFGVLGGRYSPMVALCPHRCACVCSIFGLVIPVSGWWAYPERKHQCPTYKTVPGSSGILYIPTWKKTSMANLCHCPNHGPLEWYHGGRFVFPATTCGRWSFSRHFTGKILGNECKTEQSTILKIMSWGVTTV